MAKNKNIEIGEMSTSTKATIGFGIATASSSFCFYLGLTIFPLNPALGAIMASLGTWTTIGAGLGFLGSGIAALAEKISNHMFD